MTAIDSPIMYPGLPLEGLSRCRRVLVVGVIAHPPHTKFAAVRKVAWFHQLAPPLRRYAVTKAVPEPHVAGRMPLHRHQRVRVCDR